MANFKGVSFSKGIKPKEPHCCEALLEAVRPGFEPRQTVPKTVVLPLHHRTVFPYCGSAKVKTKNIIAKLFLRKN